MPTQKDPTTFGYQNFYSTTLTGDITAVSLTIGLATVPTPTSGILVIEPDSTSSREVVFYTSKGASTITCPSDGRGWSGSTASPHLTGSTVVMVSVDEFFEGLADGTLSADPLRSTLFVNHVVSGGVVAQSAGLIGTFSNVVFYLNGQRYSGSSIANKTYTASKDTYVDITAASGGVVSVTYTEVANGAASPALAANYVRVAKVVTSGVAITSVTQSGVDTLNNQIYPTYPTLPGNWKTWTATWSAISGGANTLGNGTLLAEYTQIGKTVFFRIKLTWGTTTSSTGIDWCFNPPVPPADNMVQMPMGHTVLQIGTEYIGDCRFFTATQIQPRTQTVSGTYATNAQCSFNIPAVWGNGHILRTSGFYEAA